MEKLNELVELAKKATQGKWWIDSHGHSMVSFSGNEMEIVFVTKSDAMSEAKRHDDTGNLSHWRNDNDASFIAAANPKNILAIAEAYRALEQRAEAAEAKYSEVSDWYAKMKTRMLAAEAKLAELVPPGWMVLPIEPTKEMKLASRRYVAKTKLTSGPGFYRAMVAAAPTPQE